MPSRNSLARLVRRFNRFYTARMGLLRAGHLASPYSLAEVRVLYELAHRPEATAGEIGLGLGVDPGYMSRIVAKFRKRRLIVVRTAAHDGRQRILMLTARGRAEFTELDHRATDEIATLLDSLDATARSELAAAVTAVESLLTPLAIDAASLTIDAARAGDLGWVVMRHGEIYAEEFGWNADFERLVARIVGEFAAQPESPRHRCWIARVNDRRAGCIFLVEGSTAMEGKLRLLLVEPWARGHQLGSRLVDACIVGAREAQYQRLTLWTNDVLVAARRIYECAGFTLGAVEPHESFGKSLVSQTWHLDLARVTPPRSASPRFPA